MAQKTRISVSVIIPVHNSPAYLSRCLQAVFASTYAGYECIVVDDASTDDTRAAARRFPVRLIELPEGPYGPGYARNRAAKAARGEILLFVDADVLITPDIIGKVIETLAGRPQVAAVFGSYDDNPD
ncbi:MAG: glycosyltransferase family 2 protein, partial [bacterium]